MANYKRNKIRIYSKVGKIKKDWFERGLLKFKEENNIYEIITVFYPPTKDFVEFRFTAKWLPDMIEEIFQIKNHDIWMIFSDEGGASDKILFSNNKDDLFDSFIEKAIYSFDEITLFGKSKMLLDEIEAIMGYGIREFRIHHFDDRVVIPINGFNTGNNFFYNETKATDKTFEISDSAQDETLRNNESGEFDNIIFHKDGIEFLDKFYRISQNIKKEDGFQNLRKIEFSYKKIVTNKLERYTLMGGQCWGHSSIDGFFNCINPLFYSYLSKRKIKEANII